MLFVQDIDIVLKCHCNNHTYYFIFFGDFTILFYMLLLIIYSTIYSMCRYLRFINFKPINKNQKIKYLIIVNKLNR